MRERALLVALGLVYYVRLDNLYRERFAHELDKNEFSLKFQAVFTEEVRMHSYMQSDYLYVCFRALP